MTSANVWMYSRVLYRLSYPPSAWQAWSAVDLQPGHDLLLMRSFNAAEMDGTRLTSVVLFRAPLHGKLQLMIIQTSICAPPLEVQFYSLFLPLKRSVKCVV